MEERGNWRKESGKGVEKARRVEGEKVEAEERRKEIKEKKRYKTAI